MERKIHFRENWLVFWGIWGEAELILRIWGAKENTLRELSNFLSGIWGDQCIIFSDQGSTDPLGPQKCTIKIYIKATMFPYYSLVFPVFRRSFFLVNLGTGRLCSNPNSNLNLACRHFETRGTDVFWLVGLWSIYDVSLVEPECLVEL